METKDFTELTEHVAQLGRRNRVLDMTLAAIFMVLLATLAVHYFMLDSRTTTRIVRYEHGQWHRLPVFPGPVEQLAVLQNHEIWALDQAGDVYRFDGTTWHRVPETAFAEPGEQLHGLKVRGNSVWVQLSSGALAHYRDQTWQRLAHPLLERYQYVWNANESSVWAIDDGGQLVLYDGRQWSEIDMAARAPQIPFTEGRWARVYRAPNRGWWLQADGLWYCDTQKCREVRIDGAPLPRSQFAGFTGDRLWFREAVNWWPRTFALQDTRFFGVRAQDLQVTAVWGSSLSGSRRRVPQPLSSNQTELRLVDRDRIFKFDGQTWTLAETLTPLPEAFLYRTTLEGAEAGMAVAEAVNRDVYGYTQYYGWHIVLGFTGVSILILVGFWLASRPLRRATHHLITEATEIVILNGDFHAPPPASDVKVLPLSDKKSGFWMQLLVVVVSMALIGYLEGRFGGKYWVWLQGAVFIVYAIIHVKHLQNGDFAKALANGDYQRVCQLAAERKAIPSELALNHTAALLYSGRYREAQGLTLGYLADAVRQDYDKRLIAQLLCQYGLALNGLQRYAAAEKAMRAAMVLSPNECIGSCGLAEVYLSQDQQLDRALELAEDSLKRYPKARSMDITQGRGFLWATSIYALALSMHGRYGDAQQAIDQHTKRGDTAFQPGMAQLHWRASQVARRQGDPEGEMTHLRSAADLDPQGTAGQAAAHQLRNGSATPVA